MLKFESVMVLLVYQESVWLMVESHVGIYIADGKTLKLFTQKIKNEAMVLSWDSKKAKEIINAHNKTNYDIVIVE